MEEEMHNLKAEQRATGTTEREEATELSEEEEE